MHILPEIKLVFRRLKTKEIISNLIFYLTIPTKRKNDYMIGPFITDSSGQFLLLKSEIKRLVDEELSGSIMDYAIRFEELDNLFRIEIPDLKRIQFAVRNGQKCYPEKAVILKELSKKCNNDKLKDLLIIERSLNNIVEEILI